MNHRFQTTDAFGNLRYLVVRANGDVFLMTRKLTPLALSDLIDDPARLSFAIEDVLEAHKANPAAAAPRILEVLRRMTRNAWEPV